MSLMRPRLLSKMTAALLITAKLKKRKAKERLINKYRVRVSSLKYVLYLAWMLVISC